MLSKEASAPILDSSGTEVTRFNALRHGVLSRYTVLPWEDQGEYGALLDAPRGPTEEHLVEELAGIVWRKRRLRLAEAATHRQGLNKTLGPYRDTVKAALVHMDAIDPEAAVDVIRATAADTEEERAKLAADEVMTRDALDLLGRKRNDAYEAALSTLRDDTGIGGPRSSPAVLKNSKTTSSPQRPIATGCEPSLSKRSCPGSKQGRKI